MSELPMADRLLLILLAEHKRVEGETRIVSNRDPHLVRLAFRQKEERDYGPRYEPSRWFEGNASKVVMAGRALAKLQDAGLVLGTVAAPGSRRVLYARLTARGFEAACRLAGGEHGGRESGAVDGGPEATPRPCGQGSGA